MTTKAVACLALAAAAALAAASASPAPTPPQLNTTSFARCLQGGHPRFSLAESVGEDGLNSTDALLVWLAVYAGERFPILNSTLQEPAYRRWGPPFDSAALNMAQQLVKLAGESPVSSVTPAQTFSAALDACSAELSRENDVFCAALVSHNVFRLLGRYKTYVDKNGVDYAPAWFRQDQAAWTGKRAPLIHDSLMLIRRDNVTEKWGSWYHLHGLVAYGLQSVAVFGARGGESWEGLVVFLDTALNKLLTGANEDPVKAEEDKESVRIVAALAGMMNSSVPLPPTPPGQCATKAGYVLAPWWTPGA